MVDVILNLFNLSNDHGNGKKARGLGYVHTTGFKASFYSQELWFRRDFCNGGKLRHADLESGAPYIE